MRSRRHRRHGKPPAETSIPLEVSCPEPTHPAPPAEIREALVEHAEIWAEMMRLHRTHGPEAVRKRFTAEQLTRAARIEGVTWAGARVTKADMIAAMFR